MGVLFMIILKILLFILLAVLGIILLVLLMPLQIEFSYIGEKLRYKLKFAFINFLDSEGGGLLGTKKKSGKKNKKASETEKRSDSLNEENLTQDDTNTLSEPEPEPEPVPKENSGEPASKTEEQMISDNSSNTDDEASENSSDEKTEEKPKKTLGEKVDMILGIWRSAKRPLRKILKGFHINDIYINFVIADKDAYDCAIKYGRINAVVYNFLASLARIFTTKHKSLDISCDFTKQKCRWDVSLKVRFLPITAVISGVWFLVTYIFRVYIPNKRNIRKQNKSAQAQNTQPQGGM